MKWSWRIARVAGIGLYMHVTFLILLAWVGVSYYLKRHQWQDVVGGLAFVGALFTIVVLHELGHALTAKKFGVSTLDITLLPIGGVARLERIPEDPKQELWIALAGPAVNMALALALGILLTITQQIEATFVAESSGNEWLRSLLWINVGLAGFNLLPAFPMDGGRVLRALLAMRMDRTKATHVAATIGQAMAWVFGLVGLFTNPWLVFIALFVWMAATQEDSMVQIRSALGGLPVSSLMINQVHSVAADETLSQVVDYILSESQTDYPVLEGHRVIGVLTRADLIAALARDGLQGKVGSAMKTSFQTAAPGDLVEQVFARMQNCDCHSLPVVSSGRLIGMITMDSVGEFLLLQAALPRDFGQIRARFSAKPRVIAA